MKYSKYLTSCELNPIEACNRRCSFCPRVSKELFPNRYDQNMTPETYRNILKHLQESDFEGYVSFAGFGEPLYAKYLFEGLEIISPHYDVKLITNGDRLTTKTLCKLKEYDIPMFKVDLYDGEHQLIKLQRILKESNYDKPIFINKVYEGEKNEAYTKYYNRGGSVDVKSEAGYDNNRICHLPFNKLMIDWNGDYLLCMSDWFRNSDIAQDKSYNVNQMGIDEYLTSPKFKTFINKMKTTKRQGLTPCETCDIDGTLMGKTWDY